MAFDQKVLQPVSMRFAEIINEVGKRLHLGCIMAAGPDWVEVSLPVHTTLGSALQVRFLPVLVAHDVKPSWRALDRVGFTYIHGGPPDEQFAGLGLLDPRPASLKIPHQR